MTRSVLDQQLTTIRDNILRLGSMVDTAIDKAMRALSTRDMALAEEVITGDTEINQLRYAIEEEALLVLATQQPAASDLRAIIAAVHLAVELERMGDHAAGIARLVERMEVEGEEEIDTLHKLPKMAKRARKMLEQGIEAYMNRDVELARSLVSRDAKIDKHYNKLFQESLAEMVDPDYIRRATYLLWVGHNLERIGDRATNIAERIIFMVTSELTETIEEFE